MPLNEKSPISVVLVTVSDTCYAGKAADTSGNNLALLVQNGQLFSGNIIARKCIPDDKEMIKNTLMEVCKELKPDLILTTGGTGFSERDVTPEATRKVILKEAPGLSMAMLQESLKITPMAMLSRPLCGIRDQTLIVNLPGSQKASAECLQVIAPALPHAVDILRDSLHSVRATHELVQGATHRPTSCAHQCSGGHDAQGHPTQQTYGGDKIARRPRKSPYTAVTMDDAVRIVLDQSVVNVIEKMSQLNVGCLGKILAEDIFAVDPLPPFPASIKDGYAVISADGVGLRKVLGGSFAGSKPDELSLNPGFCVRINTGAPVPPGADAVVQVEDTKLITEADDGNTEVEIEILVTPHPGKDIRPIGSDIAVAQNVLVRGSKLGYSELGILATVGVTDFSVYKTPTVSILSTGNELIEPHQKLEPGKIRDSNKTVLSALFFEKGFPVVDLGIAEDSVESLKAKLTLGFEESDILVSTGGVSMGDKDLLKPVLVQHFAAKIHFGRVFMKPGLPTTFATLTYKNKQKLVFGLPGNPVSAAVTCNLFVIPALRKSAGYRNPLNTIIKAKLAEIVVLDPRPEYKRAVIQWKLDEPVPWAEITGNQISSRLLSLNSANCLLVLPPGTEDCKSLDAGHIVDCMVIGQI